MRSAHVAHRATATDETSTSPIGRRLQKCPDGRTSVWARLKFFGCSLIHTIMNETAALDPVRQEEFVGKVVEQISGTMTTLLAAIGDRLGLFKNLAEQGPATSTELASRTKLNKRYLREWLGGMAAASYLNYDGPTKQFTLPAEQASVLAQENGPFFVGGIYQMLPAEIGVFDQVVSAFRNGGGVSQSQYSDMIWDGLERFTSTWFENFLLQQWIPAMPDVKAHLEPGCDAADVGCGR